jgi:TolB-like protein/Tfp pilus assembly protein PilF
MRRYICTVYEVGQSEEGHLFLAMSYYGGETLAERLTRSGVLPASEALDIASQIVRGLGCAHRAGIVHRDLKPANVMLTPDGTVKILDFGLAKARDQTMTVSGVVMGTIAYMSPEQLYSGAVDARTDLWSLGVVLFEMLTGQHPSRGDDVAGTITRQVEVPKPEPVRGEVSASLSRVMRRLLRSNPDERYQSADEVLSDLTALRARIAPSLEPAAPPERGERWPGGRRARIALGIMAVAFVASGIGVVWWGRTAHRAEPAVNAGAAAGARALSLAVLPLKNYSGPDQEYFADGMTEELTSTLTKIEALRVIAHQSVAQFKRSVQPVPEIARALDVKYLVDGSVLQDSSRVRITASLIDAARNTPIWSKSFDGERRDVMTLQREVALAIAQAIEVALTPQDQARLSQAAAVNPEAFDLYIKGTQARYDANASGDFTTATQYLSRAIAIDSTYAPAYAGLAFIHAFNNDQANARALAEKAIALDPKLAEAQMVRGMVRQFFDWDWPERAYREAIALNPGFAEAHHELSMMLMRLKRFDEALREARVAVYLAPTSTRFLNGVGEIGAFSGRLNDALAIADRILAADSTTYASGGLYIRGMVFEQMGRLEDAEKAWRACVRIAPKGCNYANARIGYIYAVTGRRAQAMQVLTSLKETAANAKRPADAGFGDIAIVYLGLGDREGALNWLQRSFDAHELVLYLGIDPIYRPLHDEPRFQALLKRAGLLG